MIYHGITNAPWSRSVVTEPYVTLDGVMNDEEIIRIIAYCEAQSLDRAHTFGADPEEMVRRCNIKFVHLASDNSWFFDRMNHVINGINSCYYGFDLNGYDAFQYTSYDGAERGSYGWHMDCFMGGREKGLPPEMIQPRKLSITLALNDDYEGGEFQINEGDQNCPTTIPTKRGTLIAFPSYLIHCVRPIIKGIRRSIVIWVTGPKWR